MRRQVTFVAMASLALALVAVPATSWAQAPPLTEREVLRRARASYPMVASARLDTEVAGGELQSAEGAFGTGLKTSGTVIPLGGYPQGRLDIVGEVPTQLWGTSPFAGYRWGSDTVADYDGKLVTNDLGEVRAGILTPLWRNGPIDRRRANIEKAELGTEMGARSLDQAQLDAARGAGLRYWAWVGASLRHDVVATMATMAHQQAADVDGRVTRGDLPEVESVDARRSATQRDQQLIAAKRMLEQSAIELSVYLRRADGKPDLPDASSASRTMPPLSPLPRDSAEARIDVLGLRPDLQRLGLAGRQQEFEAWLAGNQLAPAVDVGVAASQDLGDGSPKREPFQLELSLVIDVPIDTDAAEGRKRTARAAAAKIAIARSLAADQTLADLRDARAAVIASAGREDLAREERALSESLLEAERTRLALGESTVFMVNLREQAALEAAVRQIDAGIDARRAAVVWRSVAGDLR